MTVAHVVLCSADRCVVMLLVFILTFTCSQAFFESREHLCTIAACLQLLVQAPPDQASQQQLRDL